MLTIVNRTDGITDKYLKNVEIKECRKVLNRISQTKSAINLNHNKGISRDKFMQMRSMIPRAIFFSPHYWHIFHNPDPIERERLTEKFLNSQDFKKLKMS